MTACFAGHRAAWPFSLTPACASLTHPQASSEVEVELTHVCQSGEWWGWGSRGWVGPGWMGVPWVGGTWMDPHGTPTHGCVGCVGGGPMGGVGVWVPWVGGMGWVGVGGGPMGVSGVGGGPGGSRGVPGGSLGSHGGPRGCVGIPGMVGGGVLRGSHGWRVPGVPGLGGGGGSRGSQAEGSHSIFHYWMHEVGHAIVTETLNSYSSRQTAFCYVCLKCQGRERGSRVFPRTAVCRTNAETL